MQEDLAKREWPVGANRPGFNSVLKHIPAIFLASYLKQIIYVPWDQVSKLKKERSMPTCKCYIEKWSIMYVTVCSMEYADIS